MRERPILFSAPMVRAILAGTQTQTRRVVNPQPWSNGRIVGSEIVCCNDYLPPDAFMWSNKHGVVSNYEDRWDKEMSPYGVPGDRLWVRETWRYGIDASSDTLVQYHSDMQSRFVLYADDGDGDPVRIGNVVDGSSFESRWRPSIFMPRWASRITLEVTDVRVERVQSISEEDAYAEGVAELDGMLDEVALCKMAVTMKTPPEDARVWYAVLWDSINGKRPRCAWSDNPWVWVVLFKRVEHEERSE